MVSAGDRAHGTGSPEVSVVVPAKNEADVLPTCLDAVADLDTDRTIETIVVDGHSTDGTRAIARDHGATVVEQSGTGIGPARDEGARTAAGDWYVFVDADTRVDPGFLDAMIDFARREDLAAAAPRCRMPGVRATLVEWTINTVLPRLGRPILPGFATVVRAEDYHRAGGFPAVPNEDTAFSRRLAEVGETAFHPDALVETSGRRVARSGLTGTAYHYVSLDLARLRADY